MVPSLYLADKAREDERRKRARDAVNAGLGGSIQGLGALGAVLQKLKEEDLAAESKAHGRETEAKNQARADERFAMEKEKQPLEMDELRARLEALRGKAGKPLPSNQLVMPAELAGPPQEKQGPSIESPGELKVPILEQLQAEMKAEPTGASAKDRLTEAKILTEQQRAEALTRKNSGDGGKKEASKKEAAEQKDKLAKIASSDRLREEFEKNPTVKKFNDSAVDFEKIKKVAANPSPAGDMALIYSFMHLLDPGSTVREGEFHSAEISGDVLQKINAQFQKVTTGQRLDPAMRADFLGRAQDFFSAQKNAYDQQVNRYSALATKRGATVEDIVGAQVSPPVPAAGDPTNGAGW